MFFSAVRGRIQDACRDGLYECPNALPAAAARARLPLPGLVGLKDLRPSDPEESTRYPAAGPEFRGGESAALARMREWLAAGGLRGYKGSFRRLLGDYSSRLSAHLALGCLSPRRLCSAALAAVPGGPHVEHFVYELGWRDFFRHAAGRWGPALFKREGPIGSARVRARSWRRDADVEERWKHGTTGVPLVDAAMREMLATGYLGNLARQMAAAFLVEELGLDWRVGADWFESRLIDYDPHSNWGQWTRSAGVAPTNEAKQRRVGGTRYYDLALALDGGEALRYVRAWVPEIAGLPDSELLSPWRRDNSGGSAYPTVPHCSDALKRYFEDQEGRTGGKGGGRSWSRGKGKGKGKAR